MSYVRTCIYSYIQLLNPKWSDAMLKQGSGGAYEISGRYTILYAYTLPYIVLTPFIIIHILHAQADRDGGMGVNH